MQVHKLIVCVIDHDGLGADGVRQELENGRFANRCISPNVLEIKTADAGEWADEHPLNQHSTFASAFAELFKE